MQGTFESHMYHVMHFPLVKGAIQINLSKDMTTAHVYLTHDGIYRTGESVSLDVRRHEPDTKIWTGTDPETGQQFTMTLDEILDGSTKKRKGSYTTVHPVDRGIFDVSELCDV